MINKFQNKYFIILPIVLATLASLFFVVKSWNDFPRSDEQVYSNIAKNLCQSNQFSLTEGDKTLPTMTAPPVYPFIVSRFFCAFGVNLNYIRIFQTLIFALTVFLVYLLVKENINEQVALIASVLFSIFIPLVKVTSNIFTETIFIFLALFGLYLFLKSFKSNSLILTLVSGLVFGLAALTRPILLFWPIFLVAVIFLKNRKIGSKRILNLALFTLMFYLVLAPWMVRNLQTFKTGSLADTGSLVFYNRAYRMNYNFNQAKLFVGSSFVGDYITSQIYPEYDQSQALFEPHSEFVYQLMKQKGIEENYNSLDVAWARGEMLTQAKQEIIAHPFKYLAYSGLEFFRLHTPLITDVGIKSMFFGSMHGFSKWQAITTIVMIRLVYVLFFGLVIYGMVVSWKKFEYSYLIISLAVYLILFLISVETVPRYSLPIYPIYLIYFALAIFTLWPKFKNLLPWRYEKN